MFTTLLSDISNQKCKFQIRRKPERFSPGGILNLVGNSHNIWHIVLVVTLVNWRHALLEMLKYRIDVPCGSS